MMRLTPMVKSILIINIAIHLINVLVLLPAFGFDLAEIFGLRVIISDEWAVFQFLTYMWLHSTGSIWHLAGNMFAVFIFGPLLEQVWGSKRFLVFYLVCGIGAGVLFGIADFIEKYPLKEDREVYMKDPNPDDFEIFILEHRVSKANTRMLANFAEEFYEEPNNPNLITLSKDYVNQIYYLYIDGLMVGASGAVFGLLMAFGMLFPNTYLYLYFAIPVKAKYVVLGYAILEIMAELKRAQGDNVAHLAHLGGMAIAFVMLKIWQKDSNRFY